MPVVMPDRGRRPVRDDGRRAGRTLRKRRSAGRGLQWGCCRWLERLYGMALLAPQQRRSAGRGLRRGL